MLGNNGIKERSLLQQVIPQNGTFDHIKVKSIEGHSWKKLLDNNDFTYIRKMMA
jgi:hypothetical protein